MGDFLGVVLESKKPLNNVNQVGKYASSKLDFLAQGQAKPQMPWPFIN
jgi:hypothetical protein